MRSAPADRGGGLQGFRRLLDVTILATFALIILGGIVRVSESGLGCGPAGSGTHGWPLCEGSLIPFLGGIEGETLIEFSHRLLAAVVAGLIVLCAWRARRDLAALRWPLRGSLLAVGLVLVQAGLGGLTVERNLADELVAAHLALAMVLLGLLLWLAVATRRAEAGEPRATPPAGLRPATIVATVALFGAIVSGGYVAGTERMGAEQTVPTAGAHLACGKQFPGCLGRGLFPFGHDRLADIHLTHRTLVYAAALSVLLLLAIALWRGVRSRLLAGAAALLAIQLLLGALNVWLGIHAGLIVAHLAAATLLWSAVMLIGFRLALLAQPAAASIRGKARASAAPA